MDVILGILMLVLLVSIFYGLLVICCVIGRGLITRNFTFPKYSFFTVIFSLPLYLIIGFVFMPNEPVYKQLTSYIPYMSSLSSKAPKHKPDSDVSKKLSDSKLLKD